MIIIIVKNMTALPCMFSYGGFQCDLCGLSFIDVYRYTLPFRSWAMAHICEGCSKKIFECYVCKIYCKKLRNFVIPNEIIKICFICLKKPFYSSFTWCHKCLHYHNNNSKYCIYCDVNKYESYIDLLPNDIKHLISNIDLL